MNQPRERIVIRKTKPSFTKEQKASLTLVIIAGCVALVLGGFYLVRHIASPFFIEYSGEFYFTQEQEATIQMMEQQLKDTDGDTLTDYDELYVYGSSPYLMDTDGDGYNDDTEILAGTDVDCAAGQDCSDADIASTTDLFDDVAPDAAEITPSSGTSLSDIQEAIRELTAEEIRELLVTAGADPEMVAEIPDEDLEALILEVMGDLESSEEFQLLE